MIGDILFGLGALFIIAIPILAQMLLQVATLWYVYGLWPVNWTAWIWFAIGAVGVGLIIIVTKRES